MTVGYPTDFKGQKTMYRRQNAKIKKALNVPQEEGAVKVKAEGDWTSRQGWSLGRE